MNGEMFGRGGYYFTTDPVAQHHQHAPQSSRNFDACVLLVLVLPWSGDRSRCSNGLHSHC